MATAERERVVGVERERPLASYGVLMGAFSVVFGGGIALAGATGRLPRRVPLADVALIGIAGHKVARLVAKDKVTSPIRAPFVEPVVEDGELEEEPAGDGMQRALGQLVTCPRCVGQWACAGLVLGTLYSPRATRAVAAMFAADAVSDFLHVAFRAAEERA